LFDELKNSRKIVRVNDGGFKADDTGSFNVGSLTGTLTKALGPSIADIMQSDNSRLAGCFFRHHRFYRKEKQLIFIIPSSFDGNFSVKTLRCLGFTTQVCDNFVRREMSRQIIHYYSRLARC
jgi:hypothetical protein